MARLAAACAGLALLLAGCGGEDEPQTATPTATPVVTPTPTPTPEEPTASAPSAPSPPPDADDAEPTATPAPEEQEGGAGDEQAPRVPVDLTVTRGGRLEPPSVAVPAFLALELRVRNRSAAPVTVRLEGTVLRVPAGATETRELEGLREGRYRMRGGAAGSSTLISGAEAGP